MSVQGMNKFSPLFSDTSIKTNDSSKNNLVNESELIDLYNTLELKQKGLSFRAFEYAYKGYQRLVRRKIIGNDAYLAICDFSQSSASKRMYILDIANCSTMVNTYVAHGRNSGGEYARRFSNKPKSLQSSLGFYVTKETYFGEHGLSLKMAGLERGINDKAMRRKIVMHGADYIGENWAQSGKAMGRSYGCPALPRKESEEIINTIKNGSCIFIYHPSPSYLRGSKILND